MLLIRYIKNAAETIHLVTHSERAVIIFLLPFNHKHKETTVYKTGSGYHGACRRRRWRQINIQSQSIFLLFTWPLFDW